MKLSGFPHSTNKYVYVDSCYFGCHKDRFTAAMFMKNNDFLFHCGPELTLDTVTCLHAGIIMCCATKRQILHT